MRSGGARSGGVVYPTHAARDARHVREVLELRIEHEREMRQSEARANALALEIQAAEYKRRMDDLNHEKERVRELGDTMLTKLEYGLHLEHWRVWEESNQAWRESVDRQLNTVKGALMLVAFVVPLVSLVIAWAD